MKPAGILGIILIVVSIIALAYGGYTSFTTKENVARLGPIEINKQQEHPVPLGPIIGGVCLVGGAFAVRRRHFANRRMDLAGDLKLRAGFRNRWNKPRLRGSTSETGRPHNRLVVIAPGTNRW